MSVQSSLDKRLFWVVLGLPVPSRLLRRTVWQSSANKRHIALPIFDLLIIVILLSISPTYHLGMGGASQQGILGGLRRND